MILNDAHQFVGGGGLDKASVYGGD